MRSSAAKLAQNAFEILGKQPRHGVGSKLTRLSWGDGCFWEITEVKLSPDGRHGKAYGRLTWWGQPPAEEQPHRRLHGPLKKKWALLEAAAATGVGAQAPRHAWQQSLGFAEAVASLKQQQQRQDPEGAAAEGGEDAAPLAQ